MRVAVGGYDFKDAVMQLENRNVERAAAEVVNGDDAVLAFVESIGKCSRGGFVDKTKNVKPGNAPGVFGGLTLRVVEVCRYRDDGFCNRAAKEAFSVALKLPQNQRRDFGRRIGALADLDAQDFPGLKILGEAEGKQFQLFLNIFHATPHQALDGVDGTVGRLDQELARRVADDDLILFIKRDDRWDKVQPIFAGDDGGRISLHVGDERVRRAQIDADNVISCHLFDRRSQIAEVRSKSTGVLLQFDFCLLTIYSNASFTSRTRFRM